LLEVYNHGERDRLLKNEPCFKSIAAEHESGAADGAAAAVQFTDSTTMKYSKLVNSKSPGDDDSDDGDDGDELMQQRVYDMPSSSDDSDECESDETPVVASFQCSPAMASCDGMYATPTGASELKPNPNPNPNPNPKPNPKPKLKVNHINVDDI
jgi:hypothetical protein